MENSLKNAIPLIGFLLALSIAPSGAAAAATCPVMPYPDNLVSRQPNNLGTFKLHLLNYKCFGAYDRDVAKVLARAQAYVERRAAHVAKPAIVLDIDETSLSNWRGILATDFSDVSACDWTSSANESDNDEPQSPPPDAIPATLKFFNAAKAKRVAIFFITARNDTEQERAELESDLRQAGYNGWTGLLMKSPNAEPSSVKNYKAPVRAMIEAKGFRIIANVGDQYSDLQGGYAERTFKVPNPFYFVP